MGQDRTENYRMFHWVRGRTWIYDVTWRAGWGPSCMSSKKERDAIFAQRAGAKDAAGKNHTHDITPKGMRQSGRHTEVIRQINPGRTNVAKGK